MFVSLQGSRVILFNFTFLFYLIHRPEKVAESFIRLVEEPHHSQTLYIHPVDGELFMKDEAEDFRKRIMRPREGNVVNV